MRALGNFALLLFLVVAIGSSILALHAQNPDAVTPAIPKTWVDEEIATLEVPLADPIGSPKHVSADYYYRVPVRPIYKSYPVYALGHEPPGYLEWLKQQEPEVIWDDKGHRPRLETQADWIKAGEIVFDSPSEYDALVSSDRTGLYVREPQFLPYTNAPVARDGTLPFFRYVVQKKGEVRVAIMSCGMCHTRIMPEGSILKGAQGNFPLDGFFAYSARFYASAEIAGRVERLLYAAPWIRTDPLPGTDRMSLEEIAQVHKSIPPGVVARQRTSPFAPAQVPDLIGVKDRKYFDRTGLQQHRSIVDLMRYASLNQDMDPLGSFDGFIPADFPNFKTLPPPEKAERYSDEQLYALALYVYSLQPPPNPNKFDALARRGQQIFQAEGCVTCHTPPLYTNNKLTLAVGFTPPPGAEEKYDILPISVGTDPDLAMKTRRGTGYYKVPSLKGVWYRGMFGHSGWCATLEDWFDPRRVRDDYVPTGYKPYGAKTYAVKGHPFGLNLSEQDRKALIAFLRTL